jgi:cytochrome c553
MWRLIVLILLSLYLSIASSSTMQQDEASPAVSADLSTSQPAHNEQPKTLDPLGRLNFPISDAFEIRRRIWNKVSFCEKCHALDFSSSNSYIPLLQGQNREYLYSKIKSFRQHPQSRHPFPDFTAALSDDEIIDISLYYWIQQTLTDMKLVRFQGDQDAEPALLKTSIAACLDCHGADANGSNLIPDLSGQSSNYLSYRIREISTGSSRIHLGSDAPVSCMIGSVTIAQSRQLAQKLSMVVDTTRLARGESVYQDNCQQCHENPDSGAPVLNTQINWMEKLSSGLSRYVDVTSRHKHRSGDTSHHVLSRNQWADALSYVISQSGKSGK